MIPVMKPKLPNANRILPYLEKMDATKIYSNRGPLISKLEERYADFFGVKSSQVVCSANATLALLGGFKVFSSSKIRLPAFTIPATVLAAISAEGVNNIFLEDIDPLTWMLSNSISTNIEDVTRIVVLPFGARIEIEKWKQECGPLIVDAAASIGNYERGLSNLDLNHIFVFSLHATKILGIGEGAISVFGSDVLAAKYRTWINFGFDGSRNSQSLGINAKMSEISAAYGHAALDNWVDEKSSWIKIGFQQRQIEEEFKIGTYFSVSDSVSPYWIVEFQNKRERDAAQSALTASGIDTRLWWEQGCHRMNAFSEAAKGNNYPFTEDISGKYLGLPKFIDISSRDLYLIEEVLANVLRDLS